METTNLSSIFSICYGNSLDFATYSKRKGKVNFVARTMKNNGVVGKVAEISGCTPFPKGLITVAVGGSVMESFLQSEPFYTGFHIMVLTPKEPMSDAEKLFYCHCIRHNRFKYSYGRQANSTLPDILIPTRQAVKCKLQDFSFETFKKSFMESIKIDGIQDKSSHDISELRLVPLSSIFTPHNGITTTGLKIYNKNGNNMVPLIRPSYRQSTSIAGYLSRGDIDNSIIYPSGTLYVSTNGQGSHSYAYVSTFEFVANSDVCILEPKAAMTLREKLFYSLIISKNRFKFSYGRKPKGDKLMSIIVPEHILSKYNKFDIEVYLNSLIEE